MIVSHPSLCFLAQPPPATSSFSKAKSKPPTSEARAAKAAFSSSSQSIVNAKPAHASLAGKQTTITEDNVVNIGNSQPPASNRVDNDLAANFLEADRLRSQAAFDLGSFLDGRKIFSQSFFIRSYEAQPSGRVTLESLMNYLQDVAVGQINVFGILGGDFGATREMNKRDLLWVVVRMHVELECYPSWGEIVEVKTWMNSAGNKMIRRNYHFKNVQTGQTVMKATYITMLMHKHTRKFSIFSDQVNEEMKHLFSNHPAIFSMESKSLPKFDEKDAVCIKSGLTPRLSDIDANMHVNNVKCIGFLLESTPTSILKSHQISSMSLEFRRECEMSSVLRSLTAESDNCSHDSSESNSLEYKHLLQLESGTTLVKGLTRWRPKDQLPDKDRSPPPTPTL